MFHKVSFNQILSVLLVLSQVTCSDVLAGWHCQNGQPDACINEVNGWNSQFRIALADFYEQRKIADATISNCWKQYSENKSSYEHSLKMLERMKGKNESNKEQLAANKILYSGQQNQVLIIKQIQSIHYSYIREMIQALKGDVMNDGFNAEIKKYRNNLTMRKSSISNQNERLAIDLTIGMIDEISSVMNLKSGATTSLHNRLLGEINKSDSKLSELSKKSIEYALNKDELTELSLTGLVTLASVNANSLFTLYKQNLDRLEREISATEQSILSYESKIYSYSGQLPEHERSCKYNEDFYRNQLPRMIEDHENKLNGNIAFLNDDGCRKKHCYFTDSRDYR